MPGYITIDDGRVLPSVTTILTDMDRVENNGVGKFDNFNRSDLDRLSKIGTLVHCRVLSSICELNAPMPNFPLSEYPKDSEKYCDIAEEMWEELELDISYPINIETSVVNEEHGYHGQLDLMCRLDGMITVIDLKTSARAYKDHYLQVSAYCKALPKLPERAMIISLCPYVEKNPSLIAKVYDMSIPDIEEYFSEFAEKCEKWHRTFDNDKSIPSSRVTNG